MSPKAIEQALPGVIRRAADMEPRTGQGWTVRIHSQGAVREVRLASQAQVARLTLELERLGFLLLVDGPDEDADFVYSPCEMLAATG